MPHKKSPPINDDTIARKAYELWESRGRPHGTGEDDWFEAERALHSEANGKKPARAKAVKKAAAKKPARKSK